MLTQQDLQAISALMAEQLTANNQILRQEMAENTQMLRQEIQDSQNLVLDEIGRVQTYLEDKFDQLHQEFQEMKQYYRIERLENDNTQLLLKIVTNLNERVERLEQKTA